jgi:hypothetical protein
MTLEFSPNFVPYSLVAANIPKTDALSIELRRRGVHRLESNAMRRSSQWPAVVSNASQLLSRDARQTATRPFDMMVGPLSHIASSLNCRPSFPQDRDNFIT